MLIPGRMDGADVTTRLKSANRMRDIPIIVLTTWPSRSERDRAYAAGCDADVTKPWLPEAPVKEIDRVRGLQRVPRPEPASVPDSFGRRARRQS
jgi:CheY-like chemotaxis protein